jgi:two-component system sensor kinase FixL
MDGFDRERFLEHLYPEDRDVLKRAIAEAARDGGEYSCEVRVAGKSGRYRWIASRGRIEFDGDAAPSSAHGVLVDFTERKRTEEKFESVVEAAPYAMLVVKPDGRVFFANRQAEVVFGYSREELVGMPVETLVPVRHREAHLGHRNIYASDPRTRSMGIGRDLFGLRKNGVEIPVEIALNPIQSEDEILTIASVIDISERRRLEREATMQREELAHLSRVALLAELSGSLAHELNQPLTAILSNAQAAVRFMNHTPPNLEEVRESLVNIIDSDKRAGDVIRKLRVMLRKDAVEMAALDMSDVVVDVLRIIRSDLLNSNVEIVLDLSESLPSIDGDRVQMQQVVLNLIMNGRDAMRDTPSGREIRLSTHPSPDGGVEVEVSDVGKGIPEADIDRIFEPFVSTKQDGMGLGLAICSTIVQAHQGRLWATNNAGPGATLHIWLPAPAE